MTSYLGSLVYKSLKLTKIMQNSLKLLDHYILPKVCLNLMKIGLTVCNCTHDEKINFDGFTQNGNQPQPFEVVFYSTVTPTPPALLQKALNSRKGQRTNQKYWNLLGSDQQI